MSTLQKDHLDLQQGGDTGQANVDAIQPVTDGEGATQTVFRRPSENLRGRTEETRDAINDLLYYRDHNHLVIEGQTGHTITWPGSTTAASTGIIAQLGDLTIRPLLTPDTSLKGSISIGTPATDRVIYVVASGAYATHGMNAVTVEHRNTAGATPHQCTITDGPVKRILVEFDAGNAAHSSAATKVLVDVAIGADPDLSGPLIDVTDDGGAVAIAVGAETRIEGTADQEAHRIPSGLLNTLTTSEPLAEGDAIGIWYRYVIEPGGAAGDPSDPKGGVFGGRQESNPDRATSTIPIASLFVTSNDPQKIPGAIPLCKVVNNELVWVDGTRFVSGASGPMGTAPNIYIDDTNFAGPKTNIGAGGIDNPLSPASAQEAFENVDDRLGQLRAFSYVCTDGTASTGGDFDGPTALQLAVTQLAGTGGTIYLRRGTYDVPVTYAYGDNIRIVGEHESLVTIQPTSFTAQDPSTGMRFENVTFGTNLSIFRLTSPEDGVRLTNVIFTGTARCIMTADDCHFDNVVWPTASVVANSNDVMHVSGDRCSFRNCTFPGHLLLDGDQNLVEHCEILRNAANKSLTITGNNNSLRDVLVTVSGGGSATATHILSVGGNHTVIDGFRMASSAATISTTHTALSCAGGSSVSIANMFILAGDHGALIFDAGTSAYNFRNCRFENGSTTAHTLTAAVDTGTPRHIRFADCIFDDNKNLGNSVIDLQIAGDNNDHRYTFTDCQILGTTFDNTACGRFRHCDFYNCYFEFLGVNIPGVDEGITDGLWRFEGVNATADAGRCTVQDCTFDFADVEIIDNSFSDPLFDGAYVEITDGQIINPQFTRLNRYGDRRSGTPGGSVLRLKDRSRLDGATFEWTPTAFIQAGTGPSDPGWIRVVGNFVTIENVHLVDTTAVSFTHAPIPLGVDNTTCSHFHMFNCTFSDSNGTLNIMNMPVPTGAGYTYWNWDNVQFGLTGAGNGLTVAQPLRIGDHCKITNCRFHFEMATHATGVMTLGDAAGSGRGIAFTNNLIINESDSPGVANEVFNTLSNELLSLRFCDNFIKFIDSGGGLRPLFAGAPATATFFIAVGNIFISTGGTTEDGAIVVTAAINIGVPV